MMGIKNFNQHKDLKNLIIEINDREQFKNFEYFEKFRNTLKFLKISTVIELNLELKKYFSGSLAVLRFLKTLDLSCCFIDSKSIDILVSGIKECPCLINLDLSRNSIISKDCLSIARYITKNSILVSLNLEGNKIKDEGCSYIVNAIKTSTSISYLNISFNELKDESFILFSDNLSGCSLSTLVIGGNSPTSRGYQSLFNSLTENKNIQVLDVSYPKTNKKVLSEKERIDLKSVSLQSICMSGMMASYKDLKVFSKSHITLCNVSELDLSDNKIGPKSLKFLCDALCSNVYLKSLNLSRNCIGDCGSVIISEYIKRGSALMSLSLESNRIGHMGIKYICDALHANKSISMLSLSKNCFGDVGFEYLKKMIVYSNIVVCLKIRECMITDTGMDCISRVFHLNRSLSVVDLSKNRITAKGVDIVLMALNENRNLDTLVFKGIKIDCSIHTSLVKLLTHNNHITTLILQVEEHVKSKIQKCLDVNKIINENLCFSPLKYSMFDLLLRNKIKTFYLSISSIQIGLKRRIPRQIMFFLLSKILCDHFELKRIFIAKKINNY